MLRIQDFCAVAATLGLVAGCVAEQEVRPLDESPQDTETVAQEPATISDSNEEAIEDEAINDPEAVSCGWGGPPAHCLGRCCSHANWTDLGVPQSGQCTQMVNDYCQWRGGNCGACWGYIW